MFGTIDFFSSNHHLMQRQLVQTFLNTWSTVLALDFKSHHPKGNKISSVGVYPPFPDLEAPPFSHLSGDNVFIIPLIATGPTLRIPARSFNDL